LTELQQVKAGLVEVLGEERFEENAPADQTIEDYLWGWTVDGAIACILRDYFKEEA
jgi:hypothetical protein